jgi:hypothetical protein
MASLADVLQVALFPDIHCSLSKTWSSEQNQTHKPRSGGYSDRHPMQEGHHGPWLAKQHFAPCSRSPCKHESKPSHHTSSAKCTSGHHGTEWSMHRFRIGSPLILGGFLLWLVFTWLTLRQQTSPKSVPFARNIPPVPERWVFASAKPLCRKAERFACPFQCAASNALADMI